MIPRYICGIICIMEYTTEELLSLVEDEITDTQYNIFALMINGKSEEDIILELSICKSCYENNIDIVREKMNEKITVAGN